MNIEELKAKVEEYRSGLKAKSGHLARFAETGPVGMSLIDALVATVEQLEKRVAELEKR